MPPSPPRFSGMKTVAGSRSSLSGLGWAGDVGLSARDQAIATATVQSRVCASSMSDRDLEGDFESVASALVRTAAVTGAVSHAHLPASAKLSIGEVHLERRSRGRRRRSAARAARAPMEVSAAVLVMARTTERERTANVDEAVTLANCGSAEESRRSAAECGDASVGCERERSDSSRRLLIERARSKLVDELRRRRSSSSSSRDMR